MDNSDKYYPSQVIKVHTNILVVVPLIGYVENGNLPLKSLSPKCMNFSLIIRKTSDKPQIKVYSTKYLTKTSQKCKGH